MVALRWLNRKFGLEGIEMRCHICKQAGNNMPLSDFHLLFWHGIKKEKEAMIAELERDAKEGNL